MTKVVKTNKLSYTSNALDISSAKHPLQFHSPQVVFSPKILSTPEQLIHDFIIGIAFSPLFNNVFLISIWNVNLGFVVSRPIVFSWSLDYSLRSILSIIFNSNVAPSSMFFNKFSFDALTSPFSEFSSRIQLLLLILWLIICAAKTKHHRLFI